jgi:outer membrane lipoprotein-sorting protein
MTIRRLAIMLLLALACVGTASADTAREILDKRKALDDGPRHWTDRQERMKLTIVDRRGGERVRDLAVYERREPGDEKKSILFFEAPAEVKGTGFLAFTHKGKPADQWLYLPALKRVRQITPQARTESFVGTDLSYRDLDIIQEMPSWTEADAKSSLKGEETVDGVVCHVIELAPQREDIGYDKIIVWLGKDDLIPRKLEFYDGETEPAKRLTQREIKIVDNVPVALHVDVEAPPKGTKTTIESSDVRFNQNLEADLFSQRALERGER